MSLSFVVRSLHNERGFSLSEILAACVILSIGLVALISVIPLASYGLHEGKYLSTATFLANARLEQTKAAFWTAGTPPPTCLIVSPSGDCLGKSASASVEPMNVEGVTTFPDEAPMAAPYAAFTRKVRITDCSTGTNPCAGVPTTTFEASDLRQVTVTVSFRALDGMGRPAATKTVTLTTVAARK